MDQVIVIYIKEGHAVLWSTSVRSQRSYKDLNQHQLPTQFVEMSNQPEYTKKCTMVVDGNFNPVPPVNSKEGIWMGFKSSALDLRPQI